jgi:hypothetical protein
MKRSIFLAHGSTDRERVRDFYHLLLEDGFRPRFDEFSLEQGEEHEIREAIANSHVLVLFLTENSSEKPGYIDQELLVAIDSAEERPEGTIRILPIRLDDASIPQRVAHLQWLAVSSRDTVAAYLKIRDSLAPKSHARYGKNLPLHSLALPPEELRAMVAGVKKLAGSASLEAGMKGLFPDTSRVIELTVPGNYLVFGQNNDGSKYYGRAEIAWKARSFVLTTTIGEDVFRYEGKPVKQALVFDGSHHVVYRRNHHNGCLFGEWDEGGLETLIPALDSGAKS